MGLSRPVMGLLYLYLYHINLKHFYTNRERCEVLTGYLSVGHRAGRCLGENVTLDRTFHNLLFSQEVVAAQLLPHFIPYPNSRGGLY